jgi:hypothetical protein
MAFYTEADAAAAVPGALCGGETAAKRDAPAAAVIRDQENLFACFALGWACIVRRNVRKLSRDQEMRHADAEMRWRKKLHFVLGDTRWGDNTFFLLFWHRVFCNQKSKKFTSLRVNQYDMT